MGEREKYGVVVGVDFGAASGQAIREGIQLVRHMPSAVLHFVHVLEAPADLHDARTIDRLAERLGRARIELERHVRRTLFLMGAVEAWDWDLAYHVRVGPPDRELHQVAVDVDAALIVVGAAPARGLSRLLHGRSTRRLVRAARVPVVVAHEKDFRGLPRSPEPDPPRRDQEAHAFAAARVDFGGHRDAHISGLL